MDCCGIILLFLLSMAIVGHSEPAEVECEPGEYLDLELTVCQNCPHLTFSSTRNQADHCAACSKRCFDNRNAVVVQSCNSTHDTICQCKDGYFAPSDRSQCRKHDGCLENCLKYPGSASSNAVCYEPCLTTTSVQELSVESSTGSTTVVMTYQSTGSLANSNSSLLDTTTSSSNQTASDYLLPIGLPVLIIVMLILASGLIIIHRRQKMHGCLNLNWVCRQPIYQAVNGRGQHVRVNHPPPPPRRNVSLAGNYRHVAGNDHDGIRQQLDGSDYRPATLSFDSHGTVEVPLEEPEPLHEGVDSQQNEAAAQVPHSQILPLVPVTAGGVSSEEALLHESQRQGSLSRPSSRPGVLLPEASYAQALLLSGSADVQNSPTGHDSEDRNDTSNSEDLGGSQTRPGSEDLQDSPPVPGVQDNRRTSTRPCARVPPLVMMPQRELNQANDPQHPVNHEQHLPVNYQGHNQPNNPPDVPNPVVNVESVYSMESLN